MTSALEKFRQARAALDRLRVADSVFELGNQFGAAVSAMKSAVEKAEGESFERLKRNAPSKVSRKKLKEWWANEDKKMRADDLMNWMITARNDDQHIQSGRAGAQPFSGFIYGHEVGGTTGPIETVYYNPDGAWTVHNEGTPWETRERRPLSSEKSKSLGRGFILINPPSSHLGQPLEGKDAMEVLEMAFQYYAHVYQRSMQFDPSA